jgi:hypothetical protein
MYYKLEEWPNQIRPIRANSAWLVEAAKAHKTEEGVELPPVRHSANSHFGKKPKSF